MSQPQLRLADSPQARRWALVLLLAGLAIGGWLRLTGLDTRSVTHPEMYVPGIHLPDGASEPGERMTVIKVLTGTFSSDTHPPGYYLAMLPWTKVFGTSLAAMRLPSALFGIGCVLLIYVFGRMMGRPLAGGLAALLVGASGYHAFWTQVARMFAQECFLTLLASILLVAIVRSARPGFFLLSAYVLTVAAGVCTDVYFWPVLATQMIWVLARAWEARSVGVAAKTQVIALILSSPFIAFAAYQSQNTVADLSRNIPRFIAEFASFAFLLPSDLSAFFPLSGGQAPLSQTAMDFALRIAFLALSIVVFWMGWRTLRGTSESREQGGEGHSRMWTVLWIAAAFISTGAIQGFVLISRSLPADHLNESIKLTQALVVLPLLIAAVAIAARRLWLNLPSPPAWLTAITSEPMLIGLMAVLPFLLLAALSLARPILNQRGLLFASPFLLLVMACGILALRKPAIVAATAAILVGAYIFGIQSYRQMRMDPMDYRAFALALASEMKGNELVFVHKAYYETPILYYIDPERFSIAGRNYAAAVQENPEAPVWVVMLYDKEPSDAMREALAAYREVRRVHEGESQAILFEPASKTLQSNSSAEDGLRQPGPVAERRPAN